MVQWWPILVFAVGCAAPAHPVQHAPKPQPPPATPAIAAHIVFVEDCLANFQEDPRKARSEHADAERILARGEKLMEDAQAEPAIPAYIAQVTVAIETYGRALAKDPYNPKATFLLAVAYDAAFRKGCALKLIKRLAVLVAVPAVEPLATQYLDRIEADDALFKYYRHEAVEALNR